MKSRLRPLVRFFAGLTVAAVAFTVLRAADGVISLFTGSQREIGQTFFSAKTAHADAPYAQSYYQSYYQGYYEGYYESYYQSAYAPEGSGCESSGSSC